MATPFEAPATIEGSSVRPADLNGHLLIIKPLEYKTGIATQLGVAEAIEVDLVDLDTNEEHSSVLFFNIALRNALKPNIGKQVLARIGQGTAKPGKSAPWILVNATENQADVARQRLILLGKCKRQRQCHKLRQRLQFLPKLLHQVSHLKSQLSWLNSERKRSSNDNSHSLRSDKPNASLASSW